MLTSADLVHDLAPPLDALLLAPLIREYESIERRFVLCDWEPAELDGGQFCELSARVLYHQDSGNLSLSRQFSDCLSYLENEQVAHQLSPLKPYLHISRVLRTVYKFRSDRGAVHISPSYEPNHMDAKWVLESCRWVFAELLRLFWNGDRETVATAIRDLLKFDTPCVGTFGHKVVVQRVDLTAEEELLILLHHGGTAGVTRRDLGESSYASPSAVTRALQKLQGPDYRQVIDIDDSRFVLTDLGNKRIREQLSPRLNL